MYDERTDKKAEKTLTTDPFPAPGPEDENYLYRRAEQELELAQAASHPAVVKAHYLLSDHYLEALYREEAGEMEKIGGPRGSS